MKRFMALLLCATLLAGCGGGNSPTGGTAGGGAPTEADAIATGGQITGEITVSSFNAMPHKTFLETAAALFEEKYPGTKINVDVYSSMPEIKTMETEDGKAVAMIAKAEDTDEKIPDYISKITTEMMSGGGPDLMAVDALPYYKYALGGQIENLSAYMDSDSSFDRSDYRSNLFDALEMNGGVYIMPLDYSFEMIAYDPSLFSEGTLEELRGRDSITFDEMTALASDEFADSENTRMFGMLGGSGQGGMFSEMFSADYGKYVDVQGKTADFGEKFAGLLEKAQEYEDMGYITPGSMREGMNISVDEQPSTYYKSVSNMQLMNYYSNYYSPDKTGAMKNRIMMNGSMVEDTDEILGLLTSESGNVSFTYSQAYAINSNSDNKTLAWEFLKFLASEEVQTSGAASMGGIPINIKAAEAKAKIEAAGSGRRMGMAFAGTGAGGQTKDPAGGAGMPGEEQPEGGIPEGEGIELRAPGEGEPGEARQRFDAPEMKITGEQVDASEVILTEDQTKVYDEYLKTIEQYSNRLNTFYIKDPTVTSIINTETANFFNGSKSADEVARVIQNRVGLYLSE